MSVLPALELYLQTLKEHGAVVVDRLKPGASVTELAALDTLPDVDLPPEARAFWQRMNGVDDFDPWDHSHLIGIWSAQSIAETIEMDNLQAELRNQGVVDKETDYLFWPPGIIRFLGENGNGAFVNCRKNSNTYGSVYHKSASEEPLIRAANSLNDYFSYLLEGFRAGAIQVVTEDSDLSSKGALQTNYEELQLLGQKLCLDCPAFDPTYDAYSEDPDWV